MSASEICAVCGQEVRWGWRDGQDGQGPRNAYWHRDLVDHAPKFGVLDYDRTAVEYQRHLERTRTVTRKVKGEPVTVEETYTAVGVEEAIMAKSAKGRERLAAEHEDDEEDEGHDLEPIEVYAIRMPLKGTFEVTHVDGATHEVAVPGGIRRVVNLATKTGWEVLKATYSRGPYLGAKGSLGVSDRMRLILAGPQVANIRDYGVAWWRDGKSDACWIVENGEVRIATVTELTDLMKMGATT